jgi:hypothetical protein
MRDQVQLSGPPKPTRDNFAVNRLTKMTLDFVRLASTRQSYQLGHQENNMNYCLTRRLLERLESDEYHVSLAE